MAEWLKAPVSKTGMGSWSIKGSNPSLSANFQSRENVTVKINKTVITAAGKEQQRLPLQRLVDRDGVAKSALNAEAYHKAFPKGPPFFSAATSLEDIAKDPEHVRLIKALPISNLNGHNEEVVKMLHDVGNEWAFYNGGGRWTFGDYMFKAAKQFGMKFRIDWHWNVTMGDPYYPLDSREDEYGWCNSSPQGELVPALDFELRREGLGDYRRLLTLQHLAKDKAGTPAAAAAQKLIDDRMASFKLGQRDHDPLLGIDDWEQFRAKVNDAIDALRK